VTIAKRPSWWARDDATSATDLRPRSSATVATDWHDGQITKMHVKVYLPTRRVFPSHVEVGLSATATQCAALLCPTNLTAASLDGLAGRNVTAPQAFIGAALKARAGVDLFSLYHRHFADRAFRTIGAIEYLGFRHSERSDCSKLHAEKRGSARAGYDNSGAGLAPRSPNSLVQVSNMDARGQQSDRASPGATDMAPGCQQPPRRNTLRYCALRAASYQDRK
jgi:hypothetical protein